VSGEYRPGCDCRPWCRPRGGECGVIVESKILKEDHAYNLGRPPDEHRNRLRDEYLNDLRDRASRREQGLDPRDLPYHLQKLRVPTDAIIALRNPQDTPALIGARRFIQAPWRLTLFLFLSGPTGVGKSVAAALTTWDYVRRFPPNNAPTGTADPVVWAEASELTRASGFVEPVRLRAMKVAQLLVLDDAGEESTEMGRAALVDLAKDRDAAGRRTVITTNLRPEDFRRRYGDPLAERIKAKGVLPSLWNSKSMRKTGATRAQEAV
jgi:hypothetical protein